MPYLKQKDKGAPFAYQRWLDSAFKPLYLAHEWENSPSSNWEADDIFIYTDDNDWAKMDCMQHFYYENDINIENPPTSEDDFINWFSVPEPLYLHLKQCGAVVGWCNELYLFGWVNNDYITPYLKCTDEIPHLKNAFQAT